MSIERVIQSVALFFMHWGVVLAAPVQLTQEQFSTQTAGAPFIEETFDTLPIGSASSPLAIATGTYSAPTMGILFGLWCPNSNCLAANFDNGVFSGFAPGTTTWGATIMSGSPNTLRAIVVGHSGTLEVDVNLLGFLAFYDPSGLQSVSFVRQPLGVAHAFDNIITAGHRFIRNGFEDFVVPRINKLNDTGQYWCANGTASFLSCPQVGFAEQDGDGGRDSRARAGLMTKIGGGAAGLDLTKISNSGRVLPASAGLGGEPHEWACTRDNVTGLTWEVKANDVASLRHMNHMYTWYDPNPATNGGNAGALGTAGTCANSLALCNTLAYVEAVNASALCGYSDWRMPTAAELRGIGALGGGVAGVWNNEYFPNTPLDFAVSANAVFPWAATSLASDNLYAWFLSNLAGNLGAGAASGSLKTGARGVRLVR